MFLPLTSTTWTNNNIFRQSTHQQLIVDSTNVFSEAEKKELTQKLNLFNTEPYTQILIYTTKNLYAYNITDFVQQLGEGRKVGQKGFDIDNRGASSS